MPDTTTHVRDNPWATDALDDLEVDDAILLIGTGLTMVDVVVSLVETRHHRGPIYAVSRRGLLPQVHADVGPPPAPTPTELPTTALGLLRLTRAEAATATDWRSTIDGLRPVTQATWGAAPLEERARFVRHLQPYWDTHGHRIAAQIGRILAHAIRRGQLRVFAGRLLDLTETCAAGQAGRAAGIWVARYSLLRVTVCVGSPSTAAGFLARLAGDGGPILPAQLTGFRDAAITRRKPAVTSRRLCKNRLERPWRPGPRGLP